ncbi:hypothetical protein AAY473_002356, partial [Plecturocebus cupreus]
MEGSAPVSPRAPLKADCPIHLKTVFNNPDKTRLNIPELRNQQISFKPPLLTPRGIQEDKDKDEDKDPGFGGTQYLTSNAGKKAKLEADRSQTHFNFITSSDAESTVAGNLGWQNHTTESPVPDYKQQVTDGPPDETVPHMRVPPNKCSVNAPGRKEEKKKGKTRDSENVTCSS